MTYISARIHHSNEITRRLSIRKGYGMPCISVHSTSQNIRSFTPAFGHRSPSLIYLSFGRWTEFSLTQSCCWTPITKVKPLVGSLIPLYESWYVRCAYPLPVAADRHLWFQLHSDVAQRRHHPENMGIAIGFSLLSCMQAEIYVMQYLLPINGRHLWFLINLQVRQSSL